jgi:hypothetical protein
MSLCCRASPRAQEPNNHISASCCPSASRTIRRSSSIARRRTGLIPVVVLFSPLIAIATSSRPSGGTNLLRRSASRNHTDRSFPGRVRARDYEEIRINRLIYLDSACGMQRKAGGSGQIGNRVRHFGELRSGPTCSCRKSMLVRVMFRSSPPHQKKRVAQLIMPARVASDRGPQPFNRQCERLPPRVRGVFAFHSFGIRVKSLREMPKLPSHLVFGCDPGQLSQSVGHRPKLVRTHHWIPLRRLVCKGTYLSRAACTVSYTTSPGLSAPIAAADRAARPGRREHGSPPRRALCFPSGRKGADR